MSLPRLTASILAAGWALSQLSACTVVGGIAWRNVQVALRTPDVVPNRITAPVRQDARLAVLWVGHSTALIQIDDKFVLTYPVFTRYVGGLSARLVEPGIAPDSLPRIDVTLVSHRHFDHLSTGTFSLIRNRVSTVLTPVGAGADIPDGPYSVVELTESEQWASGELRVTAVAVRHSGGRYPRDAESHSKAFTGFVIEYHGITVFFPGDTSYDEELFRGIARRFPVIDLALMPIGPIHPESRMLSNHLNPAQALDATERLGARFMVPVHFATFVNSFDSPGDVEKAFRDAVTSLQSMRAGTRLLAIGEQYIVIRRDKESSSSGYSDYRLKLISPASSVP